MLLGIRMFDMGENVKYRNKINQSSKSYNSFPNCNITTK